MALQPHFDLTEAQALIALCAKVNDTLIGDPPPKTPPEVIPVGAPIIPPNWQPRFQPESAIPPFDEYYEIWENTDVSCADSSTKQLAVVFRGTEDDDGSIIEDLLSVMIPARATLELPVVGDFTYTLAEVPNATIHAGFTLGLVSLLVDPKNSVLVQLAELATAANNEIIITGHSQGAAVATLFASFAHYHRNNVPLSLISNPSFKTYAFAQPKPGNDMYAYDFGQITGNAGFGLRVSNPLDWVPQAPFTLQQISDWNPPNPFTVLADRFAAVERILTDVAAAEGKLADLLVAPFNDLLAKLTGTDPGFQIATTLDFTGAGVPYILPLDPGIPATNPCDQRDADPPVIDFFWHHHASIYAKLLDVPAGPVPLCKG